MNERIDSALAVLYDSVLDPEVRPQAIAGLALAFDAPMATLWRYEPLSGRIADFAGVGHDPAGMADYAAYYVDIDPARPKILGVGVGRWLADEVLLDPAAAAHQAYWHEFARPQGLGRVGGGQVASDEAGCLYFGVQRPLRSARFGATAAQTFAVLAPHIARADALRRRLAAVTAGQQLAIDLLDQLSAPLAVLDGDGRVLLANRAAAGCLVAAGPLRMRHGRVCTDGTLAGWWSRALLGAGGPKRVADAIWHAPAGPPGWLLNLVPLPPGHTLCEGAGSARVLLMIGAPDAPRVSDALLRTLFGLTPAEATLLAAMMAGETVPVYARRRGLSINTVRTHVAALFDKTGCRTQLQLVALAGRLTVRPERDR